MSHRPKLSHSHLLFYALMVGVLGGLVATAFYIALEAGVTLLWGTIPSQDRALQWQHLLPHLWAVTALGGLLVGLSVKYFGATEGLTTAVEEIHTDGKLSYRHLPGMALASLLSLIFGSSAGPESPLIDINGGVGSWLGDRLKLHPQETRILTLCGMGAGMGVFFSAPLGAALFVLEVPHRRSLEFFEAIIPTLLSSFCGFAIFRVITGQTIGGLYRFPSYDQLRPMDILSAIILGGVGAGLGIVFIQIHHALGRWLRPLHRFPLLLITLGGVAIGLIAMAFPITLFYGEHEIQAIIDHGQNISAHLLLAIALFKIIALSICLHSGFRGGVVFPLFFVGSCLGMAVHQLIPTIPLAVALVCTMAAISVAIVKSPMGMVVILTIISHTAIMPLITTAALTSYFLSQGFAFIPTQRSRRDVMEFF